MNLPEHISQVNDTWYFNAKTKKYIHKEKIEGFLETYWRYRQGTKSVTAKRKYENKLAENRWFGKD